MINFVLWFSLQVIFFFWFRVYFSVSSLFANPNETINFAVKEHIESSVPVAVNTVAVVHVLMGKNCSWNEMKYKTETEKKPVLFRIKKWFGTDYGMFKAETFCTNTMRLIFHLSVVHITVTVALLLTKTKSIHNDYEWERKRWTERRENGACTRVWYRKWNEMIENLELIAHNN